MIDLRIKQMFFDRPKVKRTVDAAVVDEPGANPAWRSARRATPQTMARRFRRFQRNEVVQGKDRRHVPDH